jgi:hypothetical protein
MNRVKIDSSAIREIGHDETGCEVQYHRTGCARQSKPATVDGETRQAQCNCSGGETYLHPGVPAELHQAVMQSPSIGQAFGRSIKNARHPHTKELLYPHVKREAAKS